jgi:hypothetical protein
MVWVVLVVRQKVLARRHPDSAREQVVPWR